MKKLAFMACGHTANTINSSGEPFCVICYGEPEATIVITPPNLIGRKARCVCGKVTDSKIDLPFFEYVPYGDDKYLCGCEGWD